MIIKNIVAVLALVFIIHFAQSDTLKDSEDRNTDCRPPYEMFYQAGYDCMPDALGTLPIVREGYRLALKAGDSLWVVKNGLVWASALRRLHRLDSAAAIYDEIIGISERNRFQEELSIGLNSAGITYSLMAEYDKALEFYLQTWELRKQFSDTLGETVVLNNIGAVHYKLRNYTRALEVFLQAEELRQCGGFLDNAGLLQANIGHAYAYLGNSAYALAYLDGSIKTCADTCSATRLMEADFARGVVYFGLNEFQRADDC